MADNEETNLDIETVPVGSGSGAEFSAEPFNLDYALAGGILFAKNNASNTYYVASEFDNKSGDTWYRYRAKIRNKFYNFNNKGEMAQGKYTLYCGEGTINTAGAIPGDTHSVPDGSSAVYYSLKDLNYRETVASSVLNAMIGHITDPLSYSESTIKLLVKKSFQFAVEFMNQAIELRTSNMTIDTSTGEPVPEDNPTEVLLRSIAEKLESLVGIKNAVIEEGNGSGSGVPAEPVTLLSKLTQMSNEIGTLQSALYDDSGQTPISVITELNAIKSSQQNIATALSGSGTGLSSQLASIVTNTSKLNSIDGTVSAIDTKVGTVNSNLGGIDTRIGTTNSKLDTLHSDLGSVEYSIDHMSVSVTGGADYSDIKDAIQDSSTHDYIMYIYDKVTSIDGKMS